MQDERRDDGEHAVADGIAEGIRGVAAELTEILLDRLGPALVTHRREVARRVGVDPDELTCLDQLRRLGPLPASLVGEWLGVTRSALSKALRRLEAAGHVERWVPERRGRYVEVAWRPVADRDAVLADLRDRMRREMVDLARTYRLDEPDRQTLVTWWTVQVADLLARHARQLADEAAHERLLVRRRREHATEPDPWRGR